MKTLCTRWIPVFLLVFAVLTTISAQSGKRKQDDKDGPSRIGWGVNLGNLRFYNNAFQFGLSPNVAYRITESVAAGFMLKADYYYERFPSYDLKFSSFDFGPTAFIRWKPLWTMDNATPFLQGLFLQAEYERAYIARPAVDDFGNIIVNGNKIKAVRDGEDYLYVGLGASSGYPFASFISIHYNIIDMATLSRIPFNYRVGITYNY